MRIVDALPMTLDECIHGLQHIGNVRVIIAVGDFRKFLREYTVWEKFPSNTEGSVSFLVFLPEDQVARAQNDENVDMLRRSLRQPPNTEEELIQYLTDRPPGEHKETKKSTGTKEPVKTEDLLGFEDDNIPELTTS